MWVRWFTPSETPPLPGDPFSRRVLIWIFMTLALWGVGGAVAGVLQSRRGELPMWTLLLVLLGAPILAAIAVPVFEWLVESLSERLLRGFSGEFPNRESAVPPAWYWKWIEHLMVVLCWLAVVGPVAVILVLGVRRRWVLG